MLPSWCKSGSLAGVACAVGIPKKCGQTSILLEDPLPSHVLFSSGNFYFIFSLETQILVFVHDRADLLHVGHPTFEVFLAS